MNFFFLDKDESNSKKCARIDGEFSFCKVVHLKYTSNTHFFLISFLLLLETKHSLVGEKNNNGTLPILVQYSLDQYSLLFVY